ncbi:hypothetical protein TFLX_05290 [Thermoflexales bacterium]|nr:hypothetical protein TFLX_05290 [Thermoflexales bacterium]
MMRHNIKRVARIRGTTPEIDQRAKELRHHPTPAEALLWARLRNHQLNGYKLPMSGATRQWAAWRRRQHPLGQFIADFCCPTCRLIVELDGPIGFFQHVYRQLSCHIQSSRLLNASNAPIALSH